MKVMIDTGANRSLMSMKALQSNNDRQFVNKKYRRVFLADGCTSILVHGETRLNIMLGDTQTFITAFIVKDLCADCILGMNFIHKYKLIINMRKQTTSFYNDNKPIILKIDVHKDYIRVPARTVNPIRIPPKRIVSVPVSVKVAPTIVSFRPSYNLQRRIPLVMLNTTLTINHHISFISLHNPTTVPYTLPKGIIVGTTTVPTLFLKKH